MSTGKKSSTPKRRKRSARAAGPRSNEGAASNAVSPELQAGAAVARSAVPQLKLSSALEALRRYFDDERFASHYPGVDTGPDRFAFYCYAGWKQGLDPAGWFSSSYYLKKYDDVRAAGVNPFYHYLTFGRAEGRFPSPAYEDLEPGLVGRMVREFDFAGYEAQLSRGTGRSIDPLLHYVTVGWKEGLRPVDWFDTRFYLQTNEDVAQSGINPFHHYLIQGRHERRAPNADKSAKGNQAGAVRAEIDLASSAHDQADTARPESEAAFYGDEQANAARAEFDAAFYLKKYPDVAASGVDPFAHFLSRGWTEGRKPASWFDTGYYLAAYEDIRSAGVNPFVHYVIAGRAEGRAPAAKGPARAVLLRSNNAGSADSGEFAYPYRKMPAAKLKAILVAKGTQARAILSVSHDCYLSSVGGVQLFIAEERRKFESAGLYYMNVFPIKPRNTLQNPEEPYDLGICLDGRVIGAFDARQFVELLARMQREGSWSPKGLLIHSFAGHSPELFAEFARSANIQPVLYWVHDYFGLCPSHNLLRNRIEFCGAPAPDSAVCEICVYGTGRAAHTKRIREFLDSGGAKVVAPSAAAVAVWNESMAAHKVSKVVPHYTLRFSDRSSKVSAGAVKATGKPLRLAYCGHPAYHKGWEHFVELVDLLLVDEKVKFYHFGTQDAKLPGVKFIETNTLRNADAMSSALAAHAIDCVFHGAIWPETFSYVLYEVLAAGVPVLCFASSGNIAAQVETHRVGLIVDEDMGALAARLGNPAFRDQLARCKALLAPPPKIVSSGTSAAIFGRA